MPTYEYECTSCGQHIEVFQRISEDPLTTCGVCGGRLRKVFHPAGIVFKGSGFYATDSRSKAPSDTGPKPKKDGDKGSSPSSTSGEATPSKAPESGKRSRTETTKERSSS